MPLQATSGAASYDAFGGGVPVEPVYIEQIFSTYLYTGTSATQTITNNIDLSGKGGLVWIKIRNDTLNNILFDTTRGDFELISNSTAAQADNNRDFVPLSTGFSLKGGENVTNNTPNIYTSWTFRKQPKFFDVVTYTGNGSSPRAIAHSLGSAPGCIIVKAFSASGAGENWTVYHRGLNGGTTPQNFGIYLNTTGAAIDESGFWNDTAPTSTEFTVGANLNSSFGGGVQYVAYIFAHDAGGFGLTGTDNVISCGTYTGTGSNVVVNLGWEPQWVMIKNVTTGGGGYNWLMADNMRGIPMSGNTPLLKANLSDAEDGTGQGHAIELNPTGFTVTSTFGALNNSSNTYIYIAIRRGPMKVPTTGTSVYNGVNNNSGLINVGLVPDLALVHTKGQWDRNLAMARLTGANALRPNATNAEEAQTIYWDKTNGYWEQSASGGTPMSWFFGRAPSFMDVVCYKGTGVARTVSHNLAAVPELMIVKSRDLAQGGAVYTASTGNANYLRLFSTSSDSGETATSFWNSTTPTASVFSLGTTNNVNGNTNTYVAYLFATCAGVSKVGSYTGTGATQTINCGFTGGARFVLIKKSTSTAPDRDWYVWDTARGMVSGTDPSLKINTTAAEVNANDVYTITTGFQLVSSSDYVNASGVTYIFLAIA